MFVAQAHSLAQQARLAITLSWIAGYTNALTLLACGQVTSHMSGVAAELGADVTRGRWALASYALLLLLVFGLGAALSGLLTEIGRLRRWTSIYVWPITIEAMLLAAFAVMVELYAPSDVRDGPIRVWITALAAMAMGLQNATITRISGGVVRTTHITGVLTDLGLESAQLGTWLISGKRRASTPLGGPATAKRLGMLASVLGAFIIGAGLGTLAFAGLERLAMVPPVLFLLWIIVQDVVRPIAELEESATIDEESSSHRLPPEIALFKAKGETSRGGRAARMPNLLAWAEHLPAAARVVVLDLGKLIALDHNGVLEIRALHFHLEATGRALIVSGVSSSVYGQLESEHVIEELGPFNVCADMELAVARAYSLIEGGELAGH